MPVMIAPNGFSRNISDEAVADYKAKGWTLANDTKASKKKSKETTPDWLQKLISDPSFGGPGPGTISPASAAPALTPGIPLTFDTAPIRQVSSQYEQLASAEHRRKLANQALGATMAQTNAAIQGYLRSTGRGSASPGSAARIALLRTLGGASGYLAGEQAGQEAQERGLKGLLGSETARYGIESGVSQFNEAQRQFNAGYGLDAAKLALSADQLRETQRQFDSNWLLQSRGQGLDWLSRLLSMA